MTKVQHIVFGLNLLLGDPGNHREGNDGRFIRAIDLAAYICDRQQTNPF